MRIVVGVSGGIAAYKACELVSRLVKAGHDVRVSMTEAAAQFVAPLTFRALSGHAVGVLARDEPDGPLSHVQWAHWADALVVAPATASLIARWASGQADDLLSLVYLGFRGPVLIAPAMEAEMWEHPRTQANMDQLVRDGVLSVGPRFGRMASGLEGMGRMAEPIEIVEALDELTTPKDLLGLHIVVTAGATWEHFDPVRVLTNPSTGRMGVLIANLAARRGAQVILVAGPSVQESVHAAVVLKRVVSAEDMLAVVEDVADEADVIVGAAAVSDFRPRIRLSQKAHKEAIGEEWLMSSNPDIMGIMGERYQGKKILVGFAAETDNAVDQAAKKRVRKHLDAVVANLVGDGRGFGDGVHQAWLVTAGEVVGLGSRKQDSARLLLDWIGLRQRGGL